MTAVADNFASRMDSAVTAGFAPTSGYDPADGFALETVGKPGAVRTVAVTAAVTTPTATFAILGLVGLCLVVLVTIWTTTSRSMSATLSSGPGAG